MRDAWQGPLIGPSATFEDVCHCAAIGASPQTAPCCHSLIDSFCDAMSARVGQAGRRLNFML